MEMKKIHFDNMKNWIWITILILSLILILIGGLELFEFENPKLNKGLSASGFFLQVIYYGKMFWHKNYVQWNKKGAVMRINSWSGKSLNFHMLCHFGGGVGSLTGGCQNVDSALRIKPAFHRRCR